LSEEEAVDLYAIVDKDKVMLAAGYLTAFGLL